jgi:hypothetical protein
LRKLPVAPAERGHLVRHQLVQRDFERLGELLERFHFGILIHARGPVTLDVVSEHIVLALLSI